jgi:protein HIRA/HIR1
VTDIIDVAWSRDDSMLASVGLDNSIWIWDGYTFGKLDLPCPSKLAHQADRIHRITGHEGFVKGVTWDPVGEFLATQVSCEFKMLATDD